LLNIGAVNTGLYTIFLHNVTYILGLMTKARGGSSTTSGGLLDWPEYLNTMIRGSTGTTAFYKDALQKYVNPALTSRMQ